MQQRGELQVSGDRLIRTPKCFHETVYICDNMIRVCVDTPWLPCCTRELIVFGCRSSHLLSRLGCAACFYNSISCNEHYSSAATASVRKVHTDAVPTPGMAQSLQWLAYFANARGTLIAVVRLRRYFDRQRIQKPFCQFKPTDTVICDDFAETIPRPVAGDDVSGNPDRVALPPIRTRGLVGHVRDLMVGSRSPTEGVATTVVGRQHQHVPRP